MAIVSSKHLPFRVLREAEEAEVLVRVLVAVAVDHRALAPLLAGHLGGGVFFCFRRRVEGKSGQRQRRCVVLCVFFLVGSLVGFGWLAAGARARDTQTRLRQTSARFERHTHSKFGERACV